MMEGVQTAFEGDADEVSIVDKHGFLHDAADQVVGNEVHAQFALDHMA